LGLGVSNGPKPVAGMGKISLAIEFQLRYDNVWNELFFRERTMCVTGINKKDVEWAEAKKKCRLNGETLKMAKEMGLNPRSLIKNIPNKTEQWKAPVSIWIQEMYEKRQAKALRNKVRKEKSPQ